DLERAAVGLVLAGDHTEKGRLAGAVRADDADDAAGRQTEAQLLEEQPVAEALLHILGLDNVVAEARPGRDRDLDVALALLALLCEQGLVGGEARLALGLPRARRHAHPLELAGQRPLPRRLLLLFLLEALALLIEPRRVVALPRDAGAAIELEDPAGDVV